MITSKLTRKAQTTIPQSIRAALRLWEGDHLAYQIDGPRVILTKAHQAFCSHAQASDRENRFSGGH